LKILIPLPLRDFDPTETAIPWRLLVAAGHHVVFATPDGRKGHPDERMMTGRGLGPWRGILMARRDARDAAKELALTEAFRSPLTWADLDGLADTLDGLVLPGGHAPGMKTYLESTEVQRLTAAMMARDAPVGAICHGVIVMARSTDAATGRSVLHGRKTTALLEQQELAAWWLTRAWLHSYYRTYPETVQAEVTRALASPADFAEGPRPVLRDRPGKLDRGFVVRDGSYVSARWPGDAYRFGTTFIDVLEARRGRPRGDSSATAAP